MTKYIINLKIRLTVLYQRLHQSWTEKKTSSHMDGYIVYFFRWTST